MYQIILMLFYYNKACIHQVKINIWKKQKLLQSKNFSNLGINCLKRDFPSAKQSGKSFKIHLLSGGFLKKHTSVSEADLIGDHLFESGCIKHCACLIGKSISWLQKPHVHQLEAGKLRSIISGQYRQWSGHTHCRHWQHVRKKQLFSKEYNFWMRFYFIVM